MRHLLLLFAACIAGCAVDNSAGIEPDTTLPTQYRGFTLTGRRPGGTTIEVMVGLAASDQRLILNDRAKPLIDPTCGSGCRVFWGIKGIPDLVFSLPAELERADQYRFRALGPNTDLEITLFLSIDGGRQQLDAQSWRTLPMQTAGGIAYFEATFGAQERRDTIPNVSLSFTVSERGVPIEFRR